MALNFGIVSSKLRTDIYQSLIYHEAWNILLFLIHVLMSWGPTDKIQQKVLKFQQLSTKEIAGAMLYRWNGASNATPHALI